MSIVIDLNTICLVCLQEGELQSVYETDAETELTILEKISSCSDLHMPTKENKLPDKICKICLVDLAGAWRFRQNVDAAKTVFDSIQQQHEDEEEELAKFEQELEEHKIKIPSGLKIKRINSDTKPILLPIQLVSVSHMQGNDNDENVAEEELAKGNDLVHMEEDKEVEDSIATVTPVDEPEGEELDFTEYYETEEILEETEDEENAETITAELEEEETSLDIKVESTENDIEESVKEEKLDVETYIKVVDGAKRGRGRPRKELSENCSTNNDTNSTDKKIIIYKDERSAVKKLSSSEKPSITVKPLKSLKPTSKSVRSRKSKSALMLDAKPAKICDICGNIYKYQHALSAHMRRHNNERPFTCEFCEKAFISGVELRRHMRVHTGHKPYSCQYCGRKFSDFGSNVKHERTHTGERPYQCNTCHKTFAYAHVLSVHLRTHTGEKRFQCTRCGKGFTKKAYLQTHMEQHERSGTIGGNLIAQQQQQQQQIKHDVNGSEISAIKTVAQEECIFTTEYVDEQEVEEAYEEPEFKPKTYELDEAMAEEHLEDTQFSLVVR